MSLTLFHTQGCHLCEEAQALLAACQVQAALVDIVTDPQLVARYGERIPVLMNHQGQELGWPFDMELLNAFLWQS
ncbi:glutaredoxin family protein [Gallaecimonas xiamenensis]|uniref:Glutaredoxin n=1 Tax=Gallaecimonas xiamenensis 3-C-1 TaxID=745411 RepID=K2JAP7_9GAMM|nr:glutaredoxin family protein [Gallaecimonas xiamenensis]EKE72173.1 glutaredoxin [Gallaecimonas xiamenensis 3-C-1]